jgi:pilus assembly protein Flp/PilA
MLVCILRLASLRRVILDSRGVTAIEYGLIAALIAAVIVGSLSILGAHLNIAYNSVKSGF